MIQKQHLKSRPVCKLTFEMPEDYQAESLELCAEFNDWEPIPFKRLKSGKWKLQVDVDSGAEFQFRYRAHSDEGEWWDNDPNADRYVSNSYGSENGVLVC